MFPLSWAVAMASSVAALVGVLTVTSDLAVTNDVFKDGVAQANKVNETTDKALRAGNELPPAQEALKQSLPEVANTIGALDGSRRILGTLGTQLDQLGGVLASADKPLAAIINSAGNASDTANDATKPAATIVNTLGTADGHVRDLGPLLDETLARSKRIEAKLRTLQLLPAAGN